MLAQIWWSGTCSAIMTSRFHAMIVTNYSSVITSIDCLRILKNVQETNSSATSKKYLVIMCKLIWNFYASKMKMVNGLNAFNTSPSMTVRIRALKKQHNQARSIDFINYVVDKFHFRIKTIRTDNSREFQTKFQWYVAEPRLHSAHAGKTPYEMLNIVC